jgi:hypothetical protein
VSAPAPTSPVSAVSPPPSGWNSETVPDFPKLFEDFKKKRFTLLWRASRDGFGARDFHSRCNGHPNTLTVILDTNGNIFGGFTPVQWESRTKEQYEKADPSLKTFLFTLTNPHNVPARKFALKAEKRRGAIWCNSDGGPSLNAATNASERKDEMLSQDREVRRTQISNFDPVQKRTILIAKNQKSPQKAILASDRK